jgi:hypothetical protein
LFSLSTADSLPRSGKGAENLVEIAS